MQPDQQLPEAFCQRLDRILQPEDFSSTLASMQEPKRSCFRINPLRWSESPESLVHRLKIEGIEATDLAGIHQAYSVSPEQRDRLTRCALVEKGQIYVTNPSSMLAVDILAPEAGEELLDLAAAPGGKTILAAGYMANRGRIAAVDVVKGRFHRMRANLERCGVTVADTYLQDGRVVGAKCPARFDRVLLDAPCSSEARFRMGDLKTFDHWSERKIRETSRKQKGLLKSAFRSLKPQGKLLYCTCSFSPEENEQVINTLLRKFADARVVPLGLDLPQMRSGLTSWNGRDLNPSIVHAGRVVPDALWDGFFVCLLTKLPVA